MPYCNFSGWFSEVIPSCTTCRSQHFDGRPTDEAISLLVIHNISLPPEQFGGGYIQQFFTGSLDASEHPYFKEIEPLRVSSHFLIDRKGTLTQFVKTSERAWHAGDSNYLQRKNCNDFSIGIELEGSDTKSFTDVQYKKLAELANKLMDCYVEISPERIVGHEDISPGRKTDPGIFFDWRRFYQQLALIQ